MMRAIEIPHEEYDARIRNIQRAMKIKGYDLLITHACECESATVRYLTNFWAVFDFVGVIIPADGKPILLTGGPESYDFAKQFAEIDDVRVHPLYVETCAPDFDKPSDPWNYRMILDELRAKTPIRRIAIGNCNTLPYKIYADLLAAADGATIVEDDTLCSEARWIKTKNEIDVLREAYRITEEALKETVKVLKAGVTEKEVLAKWKSTAFELGAEGFGYPVWVTSGPNTYQSLCKSTDRVIGENEVVQFSVGAKYNGYCGNIGRVCVLGKIPERHLDMIKLAKDCVDETLDAMKPGIACASVYEKFQKKLVRHGFGGLSLYGPAHATGMQEVDGPWVDNRSDKVFVPGTAWNVDIWIADDKYGVRLEDGAVITQTGIEVFTPWHRDIIWR
ncbi:MAG: Xaa-Pro peptidase family protein [Clostridia bacterium]